nr:PREDICTED: pickpocket protein 28 [Tribolium castaneum]|eukprot:XP_008193548.2 PREDICTED: pickpocket protein 28 [Tribolium castaneum]
MKRSFFTNVREYFREYCNRTSVHGFQYFGEKKRTIFERIWWFIMFSACLAACTFSIYAVYKKWERSPVIVNFANRGTPIYEIPFPAVTICPEAKSDQNLFNFTKLMHKLEDDIALTPDDYHTHAKINVLVNPLQLHNVAMIRPEMTVEKEHSQQSPIFKYFKEYNDVTGIHGLRYITERRSTFEKIFWTNIVLVSLACCLYMIYEILQKYQTSPVVVNFSTRDTPVYEFPFPSVTICPESKYSSKKFNFTQMYFQLTESNKSINYDKTELLYFNYINLLCDKNFIINNGEKILDDDFYHHIHKLAPEIVMECDFMGVTYDCKNILTPVITDQGICYSFNILDRGLIFTDHVVQHDDFYEVLNDSKHFNTDSGYAPESGIDTYPQRALMSGALNSLDVYLKTNSNDTDYICSNFMQGFRILIHNPWDVPRLTQNYFRVPIDKIVTAAISPELILTSDAVRKFSPDARQCYLSSERSLRHFKVYTQSNCLFECLTNYTLEKCGCVNYFMPRDNLTRICGSGNVDCMEEAESELKTKNFGDRLSGKMLCDCKPPCTSLMYQVETSHSDFYWREYFKIRKRHNLKIDWKDAKDEDHWSVLSIFFKAEQFMTLERNELYGVCDLIANLGGLLGLFTGFSLITMVEIIYFLTLRIWCNYKLFGRWSGE